MSSWTQFVAAVDGPAVGLVGLMLAAVVLAHFLLTRWARRKARLGHPSSSPGSPPHPTTHRWLPHVLGTLAAPLVLLLWVHGLYAMVRVVVLDVGLQTVDERWVTAVAWTYRLGVAAGILWLLSRVGQLVEAFLVSLSTRTQASWDDLLLPLVGKAVRRGLPLLAIILDRTVLSLPPVLAELVGTVTSLLLVGLLSYMAYEAVDAAATFLLELHRTDVSDNLEARAIYTQVTVLRKIALVVIGILTLASMLMVFEPVRQFGASILASAGLAGIVVGFAAQRSIATLLAGFQIALTQPIRVDDVVIVEKEWGNIEEITLTYVVVRIWDLRRLVVPITYFIEQPFQNWTRTSARILGTVFLYVDYAMPLDALRAELTRILAASPRWDGEVNVLQVTDAKEHTLEVRALASAADASRAWDLRCEVREKLVSFVQQQYPACLPRFRTSFESLPTDAAPQPRT